MPNKLARVLFMKDEFQEVHEKLKKRDYDAALGLLLNSKTGKIRSSFISDANHAWYLVGDLFYKRRQYDQAVEAFLSAVECRDDDAEAMWAIANCYSDLGDPKAAEKYQREAVKVKPDDHRLLYNLGNALFDQGQYEDAMVFYKMVGKHDGELY